MIPLRSARTFLASGAIVALAGLTLAACGSSGGSSSSASAQPPKTSSGTPATVGVTSTSLGNILVDAQGRTLYLFQKDTGTTSTCTGACATFWPPLIAPGAPTTGSGANASLIGTTMRQDGKTQVTYNGHPVYLYSGDHNPGDTNGEGVVAFGASWFALSGSGSQVTGSASNAGSGGGGGY
jgi:predicted lipoprotein with Yx(FWY)xxD motif